MLSEHDTMSSDGSEGIFVSREIASHLGIFKGLTYIPNSSLLIKGIEQETFEKIVYFYTYVYSGLQVPKPLPFQASFTLQFQNALGQEFAKYTNWINSVANEDQHLKSLWKLLEAANFLHAQEVLDLCCARIAFEFKGMTRKDLEFCKYFN